MRQPHFFLCSSSLKKCLFFTILKHIKISEVSVSNNPQKIIIITTGGTIEKTYSEFDGSLMNRESIINDQIFKKLRLPYTELEVFSIFSKDSLEMDDDDREFLLSSIKNHMQKDTPIIVLHGTDTMQHSAEFVLERLGDTIDIPIIFTGAMRPLGFFDSDARQNVTEALLAARLVKDGVYISFHSRVYNIPGCRKNKDKRTFEIC